MIGLLARVALRQSTHKMLDSSLEGVLTSLTMLANATAVFEAAEPAPFDANS